MDFLLPFCWSFDRIFQPVVSYINLLILLDMSTIFAYFVVGLIITFLITILSFVHHYSVLHIHHSGSVGWSFRLDIQHYLV